MTATLQPSTRLPPGYRPTRATRELFLVVCTACGPLTNWPMRRVVAQALADAHECAGAR